MDNDYMQFVPKNQSQPQNDYMQFVPGAKIPNHENLLQRMIATLASGPTGLGGQVASDYPQQVAPYAPLLGSLAGGFMGPGGMTAGATIGEYAKEKALDQYISPWAIKDTAIKTGATELGFGAISPLLKMAGGALMNSVLKSGNPELGEQAAQQGLWGTKQGIIKKAGNLVRSSEDKLQSMVGNSEGMVHPMDAAISLDELHRSAVNIGNESAANAIKNVQNMLIDKGEMIPVEEANQLKMDLYKSIRESQFGTGEVPATVASRKQAAHGLKTGIENIVPRAKEINKDIATGIQVRDAMTNRIASESKSNPLPGIFETAVGVGSAIAHKPQILMALIARHLLSSTPARSGIASLMADIAKQGSAGRTIAQAAVGEIARRYT